MSINNIGYLPVTGASSASEYYNETRQKMSASSGLESVSKNIACKLGSNGMEVCGASNVPTHIYVSGSYSAGIGTFIVPGCGGVTTIEAGAAIETIGSDLVVSSGGKAIPLPAISGTYYIIGQAIETAASGANVTINTCVPRKIIIS